MAKKTLLELTQNILSAVDGDEVDSITDTVQSIQVADTIRETYDYLIANKKIPEHYQLFQLTALGDTDKPNYMKIPTDVDRIEWIKYNTGSTKINYTEIKYLTPEEFLDILISRNSTDTNIKTVSDSSGVSLLIKDDVMPTYYTSFDDEYLVFDSWDDDTEASLQQSKTMCYGIKEPTWTHTDTFTPDIDSDVFPLLLSEAKSTYFVNHKQTSNPKEEQKSRQQRFRLQMDKHRTGYSKSNHNYGR